MSWLADIAGRAEDLLNRVDKSAAGALQKNKNSPRSEQPKDVSYVEQELPPKKLSLSNSFVSSQNVKSSSMVASPARINKPRVDEDEKLLEFLNSTESAKPLKKSPLVKKEKIDENLSQESITEQHGLENTPPSPFAFEEVVELQEAPQSDEKLHLEETEVHHSEHSIEVFQEEKSSYESTMNVQPDLAENAKSNHINMEHIQQLELENKLLHNEVKSLTQELNAVNQRCKESEGEIRRLQKKSEHWNCQVSTSDHLIRELQEKESDLLTALDAKDSQLAVLRVRIQETDQELMVQRKLLDTLRNENEKILKDLSESSGIYHKTLESLQEKIQETELALRHEQEARKLAEVESLHHFSKLEEEQKSLTESLTSAQKKYMDEKALNKDQLLQIRNLQMALDMSKQDLSEYRQKAQRILQSKEKLISTLKESHEEISEENVPSMEAVELEDLRQERDSLREELQRSNASLAIVRADLLDAEQGSQQEIESIRQQAMSLEKQLQVALQRNEEIELEFGQQKEELRYVREDLTKTKANLQLRIKDRDCELEKLRKQLTTKQLTSSSQSELETRIRALTENLIQKQTLVETLSTEKNSLVMQLERLEQKMKDSQVVNSRNPVHVGISVADDDSKMRLPLLMTESPYDNTVTRRVKRAYGLVDAFSIRLGVFLRHYPIARVFVIFYMILLHLWVMVVLLTYQPEIHGSQKTENETGQK